MSGSHRAESSAAAAAALISALLTVQNTPFCLSLLSVAGAATVKQVEQNDALQCLSEPLVHTLNYTHGR